MTKLMQWLINHNLRAVCFAIWAVCIPFVIVFGMLYGIFEMSKAWVDNIEWIKNKDKE